MGSLVQLNVGTHFATHTNGRAASSHLPRVPPAEPTLSRRSAFLLRRSQVLAHFSPDTRPAQYPHTGLTAGAAWRKPTGISEFGLPLHSDATAKVRDSTSPNVGSVAVSAPGRRFFSEAEAQRLTLAPGLPHHRRHPVTPDEALAGLVLVALGLLALGYLLWRFA